MGGKLCEGHFLCWQRKCGAQPFLSTEGWLTEYQTQENLPLKKVPKFCVANKRILAQGLS